LVWHRVGEEGLQDRDVSHFRDLVDGSRQPLGKDGTATFGQAVLLAPKTAPLDLKGQ
jgi:hypothetical protein